MDVWLWRDGDVMGADRCLSSTLLLQCNTTSPPSGIIMETHFTTHR